MRPTSHWSWGGVFHRGVLDECDECMELVRPQQFPTMVKLTAEEPASNG